MPAIALTSHPAHSTPSEISRRELYFFNLFRVFQATVIAGLIFSPFAVDWVTLTHETLARSVAFAYIVFATFNLFVGARTRTDVRLNVAIALAADIGATTFALYAIKNPPSGIAMLLMVNVGAGALLLQPRLAFFFAALATLGVIALVPVVVKRLRPKKAGSAHPRESGDPGRLAQGPGFPLARE